MESKKLKAIEDFIFSLKNVLNIPPKITSITELKEIIEQLNGTISIDTKEPITINKINDSFNIQVKNETLEDIATGLGILFIFMGYLIDDEKWKKSSVYRNSAYNRFNITYEHFLSKYFVVNFICNQKEFIKLANQYKHNNKYDIDKISNELQLSDEYIIIYLQKIGLI